jgi:hypothetical protein
MVALGNNTIIRVLITHLRLKMKHFKVVNQELGVH